MYNPCFECLNRYGKEYAEECENTCDYAKVAKENKELKDNTLIFPHTIGNITFYTKQELVEWVEIQQILNDDAFGLLIETNNTYVPNCCKACSSHPSNGGSGVCNCTLPYFEENTTGNIIF